MNRFESIGRYLCLDGIAKKRGLINRCNENLNFYSTDMQFIIDLMYNFSNENDCYEVKVAKVDQGGIYQAECHFTNESALGDLWAKYVSHPKVCVAYSNFAKLAPYRAKIRSYEGLENAYQEKSNSNRR